MKHRLSNGLTPEQDAAFDRLARAIAEHMQATGDCDCILHKRAVVR